MTEATHLFMNYRECVRHLWNAYFRAIAEPTRNWDVRDEFDEIAREIFSSLVSREIGAVDFELAKESSSDPITRPDFHIVPGSECGVPILINRDLPRSGYWDYPISRVEPNDVEMHLLRFFDFEELGYREYQYFEVMIDASVDYPDLVGRAALIEVQYAKVLFTKHD